MTRRIAAILLLEPTLNHGNQTIKPTMVRSGMLQYKHGSHVATLSKRCYLVYDEPCVLIHRREHWMAAQRHAPAGVMIGGGVEKLNESLLKHGALPAMHPDYREDQSMRIIRALFDGLILRCPRCHQGRMFLRGFTMNRSCPHCGLQFEQASGEVTGGMGINFVLTLFIVIAGSLFGLDPTIPIVPLLGGLVMFAIVFPIAFYRSSRGLWAAVLYLTGDNTEGDSASHT